MKTPLDIASQAAWGEAEAMLNKIIGILKKIPQPIGMGSEDAEDAFYLGDKYGQGKLAKELLEIIYEE